MVLEERNPTETKVESGTSQIKSGPAIDLRNIGLQVYSYCVPGQDEAMRVNENISARPVGGGDRIHPENACKSG